MRWVVLNESRKLAVVPAWSDHPEPTFAWGHPRGAVKYTEALAKRVAKNRGFGAVAVPESEVPK